VLGCILGQDQRIPADDVVDVGTLLRQHIDIGDIRCRAGEITVDLRTGDNQNVRPPECG